ncbi:ABC-2 type transport system permease protein [Rhizobiales bacterium GAS113]|jgi:ABC-2 type transport system permease protein|nr:ABC-2 type transport system permease protein [Rhizobiales bacterium GAS113]
MRESLHQSLDRIAAMTLRYWYMLRGSWPRLLELVYWPAMSMVVWGFLQLYLSENKTTLAGAAGLLLGAVLLWDILFRGQLGFTFSFLEEIWSRNIANLMMSPLRPAELAAALMVMSLVRLIIGTIPVTILAALLFGFNIFGLGLGLIAFFANLVLLGWALGLFVSGVVLRNGLGAESLAYSMMIVLLPVSCVYYPVTVLPFWLQPVAWCLPTTYVFEGLRGILLEGAFRGDLMLECLALNLIYLGLGFTAFVLLLRSARHNGALLTMGE